MQGSVETQRIVADDGCLFMFTDKINNLKIKHKLVLLVLVPTILVVGMAVGITTGLWKHLNNAHSSYANQELSLVLANLVHEFQLERDISAGYLGSGGKRFGDKLRIQRTRVDKQILSLQELIVDQKLGNEFWNLKEYYQQLQKAFNERGVFRSAVDALSRDNDFFRYYSDVNARTLRFSQQVSTALDEAPLIRQLEAYSTLLWLQEYAGQERGIMHSVFASGKLDVKTTQIIEGYITKQNNTLRRFRKVVATAEQRRLLNNKLRDPSAVKVRAIRRTFLKKSEKNELFNSLQTLIGYGGAIHDFKNYVLRGTPGYRERFNDYFNKAEEVVRKYGRLPDISEVEKNDLDTVITTFRRYQKFVSTVETMHFNAASIKKIDEAVKVDDGPALAATKRLRESIGGVDAEEWFRHSTKRISLIKEVSDKIGRDITRYAERTIANTRSQLSSYVLLMIIALAITLLVAILVTKRLVFGVTGITQALQRVKDTGDFSGRMDEQGEDEIGMMGRSFNLLIAERRRIEKTLRLNRERLEVALEEAEKASHAKSEFLSRMSHELRTPLNAILGFAQILEYDKNALSPEQLEQVGEIHMAGDHLLALINEVLDLAKIETGHIELTQEPVALNKILQECVQLILPDAQQSGIDLRYPGKHNQEVMLHTDPVRLKEVMLNLLSNAVKYNQAGGTVSLTVKPLADNKLRIEVTDTGPGLSAQQQGLLFQPFERLGAEHSGVGGVGIGLVICKLILEMMGGTIGVESVPGKGSTFWIELNC
ncbi:MAG TPA: HAMP domain-containing protein [Acidiferrobacteraceae bacterium]|nr:HAMP domain-containing protein [Acidiferrobacteraceae bacterium]